MGYYYINIICKPDSSDGACGVRKSFALGQGAGAAILVGQLADEIDHIYGSGGVPHELVVVVMIRGAVGIRFHFHILDAVVIAGGVGLLVGIEGAGAGKGAGVDQHGALDIQVGSAVDVNDTVVVRRIYLQLRIATLHVPTL